MYNLSPPTGPGGPTRQLENPGNQWSADPLPRAEPYPAGDLGIHCVEDAILHTVIYADLFDFPLTAREIHRYLIGYAAPASLVEERLEHDSRLRDRLGRVPPFWFLIGRDNLVPVREERERSSRILWESALRYGQVLASLPYVRMLALTGSLAMNNAQSAMDDIDYLLATRRQRVWLSRALAISVVRWARHRGVHLCPNYVMAENDLNIGEPSLFAAHELAQMVPLCGHGPYRQVFERNPWVFGYLPNFAPYEATISRVGWVARHGQRAAELLLRGSLGNAIERRERDHKIPRLRQEAAMRGSKGAVFTADLCKGHMDDHAALVYRLYQTRLAANGV